jgi:hypothetical protein
MNEYTYKHIEGKIHCKCKECDFYENSNCILSHTSIDSEDNPFIIIDIDNLKDSPNIIEIDEDGCNTFHDKWDLIEAMDR